MDQIIDQSRHLPQAYYRGTVRVAFTMCLDDRHQVLTDAEIPTVFRDILVREANSCQCNVLLYLFMPDHCHLILEGKSEFADTLRAITRFKRHTEYWLQEHRPGARWEEDFFDRILHAEDEIHRHIQYVLKNPVGKGLVSDWKLYPFKGSTVHDFHDW